MVAFNKINHSNAGILKTLKELLPKMQRRQGPRSARLKFENTPTDWVDEVDGSDWVDVAPYLIFVTGATGIPVAPVTNIRYGESVTDMRRL